MPGDSSYEETNATRSNSNIFLYKKECPFCDSAYVSFNKSCSLISNRYEVSYIDMFNTNSKPVRHVHQMHLVQPPLIAEYH